MTLEQKIDRIYTMLREEKSKEKRETWVGPSWIKQLTDWNHEKLRQAREQKIIEYRESPGGGYQYKLESIPEQFIKAK